MVTSKLKRWLLAFVGSIYARLLPSGKKPADSWRRRSRRGSRSSELEADEPPVDFSPMPDRRFSDSRPVRLKLSRPESGGRTLKLSEDDDDPETGSASWVEVGQPGTRFATGLPVGHEKNEYFAPVKVRGQSGDIGRYRQLARSSPTYRRGLTTIEQGLISLPWSKWDGDTRQELPEERVFEWRVKPSEDTPRGRRRARLLEKSIQDIKHGWAQFVREWLTALVDGFCIFEPVFYKPGHERSGLIRKLGFREQSTVERWVLDENERDLLGVQFATSDRRYTLGANEVAIYSHRRTGMVWEGDPPLRSVSRHIEAVQHYHQTSLVSAEVYGVPWMFSEVDPDVAGQLDEDVQDRVEEEVTNAKASQRPFMQPPYGVSVRTTSPQGKQPDFTGNVDQHREMILNSLKAEGAMMGVNAVGARAAREVWDDEMLRQVPFYAYLITQMFNVASGLPYDGLLQLMVDRRWGEPLGDAYPELELYVYPDEDEIEASELVELTREGLIEKTPDVKKQIHRRYNLPVPDSLDDSEQTSNDGNTSSDGGPDGGPDGPGGGSPASSGPSADGSELAAGARQQVWVELKAQQNKERARSGFTRARNLAKRALQDVARRHRKWARDQIDEIETPDGLRGMKIEARRKFLNVYREELENAYVEAAKRGVLDSIRDLNVGGETSAKLSDVNISAQREQTLEVLANARAEEMFNRQQGLIQETGLERVQGADTQQVPKLADSTVEDIAKRGASRAYTSGRGEVSERASEINERMDGPPIKAERINPLDEDTCSVCEKWHGTKVNVNSQRYKMIEPPGLQHYRCEADGRCRCLMTYIPPPDMSTERFRQVLREKGLA